MEPESFYPILQKFLEQAQQTPVDLKTGHYPKTFSGYRLEVSFGAGNAAKIPWIAILKDEQRVSNGIYPVYLLYKDSGLLILAYGLSETQSAQRRWHLPENSQTIKDYFREHLNSRPDRYGGSYVYRVYDVKQLPDEGQINKDILELLSEYEVTLSTNAQPNLQSLEGHVSTLIASISASGFHYEPWQVANFLIALKTKPFAILAGISGTGKTKLPTLIGGLTSAKVDLIAVRPDWTDSSDLIGYQNLQDVYIKGQLLKLAEEAQASPERMHLCILDEMNLARVEQYFAEVLSLIEDRRPNSQNGYRSHYPLTKHAPEIFFPGNLLIVGTVNMDETTHGFSKKVLDRAFTLEMSEIDLSQWHNTPRYAEPAVWPSSFWQPLGLRLADLQGLSSEEVKRINDTIQLLNELNRYLMPAQLQIGYRVRDEVCLYLLHARELQQHFITQAGHPVDPLDLALLMKILPRIQGSSLAIREVLRNLLSWSTKTQPDSLEDALEQWKVNGRPQLLKTARFPRTAARLMIMYERYLSEGFTSYWL